MNQLEGPSASATVAPAGFGLTVEASAAEAVIFAALLCVSPLCMANHHIAERGQHCIGERSVHYFNASDRFAMAQNLDGDTDNANAPV